MKKSLFVLILTFIFCNGIWANCRIGDKLQKAIAKDGKKIPVLLVFKKQFDVKKMLSGFGILSAADKKEVTTTLKAQCDAEQFTVRSLCTRHKNAGALKKMRALWMVNAMVVEADANVLKELALMPDLSDMVLDARIKMIDPIKKQSINAQATPPEDWGIVRVQAPEVNAQGIKGQNTVVAVLDTGVDLDHPELQGRLQNNGVSFIPEETSADDLNGHGTHCAGTVAGLTMGVAPEAKILPVKVLDQSGSGTFGGIIEGIEHASNQNVDVISMSLGGPATAEVSTLEKAVQNAIASGVICVIAGGNSGPGSESIGTPGTTEEAITVGAMDFNDNLASFSSRGPTPRGANKPDLVAPGVDINSAVPGGGFGRLSGTSMATPHVAGIAALMRSKQKSITPAQVKEILISTAVGTSGTNTFGAGTANALKAIEKMSGNPSDPGNTNPSDPKDPKDPKNPKKELKKKKKRAKRAAKRAILGLLGSQKRSFKARVKRVSIEEGRPEILVSVQMMRKKKPRKIEMLDLEMLEENDKFTFTEESVQAILRFANNSKKTKKFAGPAIIPDATDTATTGISIAAISSSDRNRILQLVNAHRAANGRAPLRLNSKLNQAAQKHSDWMAQTGKMSHTGKNGSSMADRINATGYKWRNIGENVAAGYSTANAVFEGWKRSPGHNANMLNPNFKEIGIGKGYNGSTTYKHFWTQDFGTQR